MIDMNVNEKPYKVGDRLILEIEITDEEKSFDFLGKAILNQLNTSALGFTVEKVAFNKDKYIDNIPLELRNEIINRLQEAMDDIRELTSIY